MKPQHPCRDCGTVTSNLYWMAPNGTKMKKPRCQECHEKMANRRPDEIVYGRLSASGSETLPIRKTRGQVVVIDQNKEEEA